MIRRLLIANRGEIAMRIIHACRELGIETVAVFSDADASAPHVGAADQAVRIGPPPAVESYLAIPRIIDAARGAKADAVHPGYGFLSENETFAQAVADTGLVFVGPPASVIARMGSKIEARRLAAEAGVPIVPGETPTDQSDAGVRQAIDRVGLPALIKASAGGGGRGMRRVRERAEIGDAIESARREALAAFGDGTLYVERVVEAAHHVEVQVFADRHGRVVHLFERECSVQRRHQKVIEESPSPILSSGLRARMTGAGVAVARAAGYVNAGTIEFLVDAAKGDDGTFYFLEMNTRLQVEHPVTEQVTGLDLVRAQLLVAAGEPLPWRDADLSQRGHAIEARVYAEDPERGFMPQAGRLVELREPRLPGVRVDIGVAEGSDVSVYYDPMIAKVIATAERRDLAIARLIAALRDFHIAGVTTNIPFLQRILTLDAFRAGDIDTGFLDRSLSTILGAPAPTPALHNRQSIRNPQSAIRNSSDPWDGVAAARPARAAASGSKRRATLSTGALVAPMPATVVKVHVKPGDVVKQGDVVVLLEAMKMELPIRAGADATVTAVHCREGELVQPDALLVELT